MTKKRKAAKRSKAARRRQPGGGRPLQAARRALSVATDSRKSVKERIAAMPDAPGAIYEDDKALQKMLNVLRDADEPIKVRLSALQALHAASFSAIAFESCRSDYIAALRAVADDPDPELRQRVLGILAREKDGYAQKKLLEGLDNPAKALVPPEKALQLLGYDVHGDVYKAARRILENPPNDLAKREALRLLAADTTAKPVFEKILRDKEEKPEYRRLSASALQAMAPDSLQRHARAILLDPSESDEVQAASLTAMTQFGADRDIAGDDELKDRVNRLSDAAPSARLKQTAKRFMTKYGQ